MKFLNFPVMKKNRKRERLKPTPTCPFKITSLILKHFIIENGGVVYIVYIYTRIYMQVGGT